MMKILRFSSLVLLIILFSCSEHKDPIDPFIRTTKVNERVIVAGIPGEAVTAIATRKGIIVIDAGISNSLTAKYRVLIEKEFGRKDFPYLINTHSHQDHTGGNQVFAEAVIIGHENVPGEMAEHWKKRDRIREWIPGVIEQLQRGLDTLDQGSGDWEEAFIQKLRFQHFYNDLRNDRVITPPVLTFSDRLNLDAGDLSFNMIWFGKAHSGSDILIHIPGEKILMAGDLFSKYGKPHIENIGEMDPARWVIVREWIGDRMNDIERVIGGHGQMMTREDLEGFIQKIDKAMEGE